jgi:hypothetical protein
LKIPYYNGKPNFKRYYHPHPSQKTTMSSLRNTIYLKDNSLSSDQKTPFLADNPNLRSCYHHHPGPKITLLPRRDTDFPFEKRPCPNGKSPHLNGNPNPRSCDHHLPPPRDVSSPRTYTDFPEEKMSMSRREKLLNPQTTLPSSAATIPTRPQKSPIHHWDTGKATWKFHHLHFISCH